MDIMKRNIGATGIATGENSALRGFEPAVRLRTRHGAGTALVDLASRSASWRCPVS